VHVGQYSDTANWGHEMDNITKFLIAKGKNEAALEVATLIRDPELVTKAVLMFIKSGHEAEAIELAARNPDGGLTTKLLLRLEYQDKEAALDKLFEIIQSDDYAAEKRAGCLEALSEIISEIDQADPASG